MSAKRIFVKGNEAVARGALAAGCRCYFGYPITPQNDIPEFFSAAMGASWEGAPALRRVGLFAPACFTPPCFPLPTAHARRGAGECHH